MLYLRHPHQIEAFAQHVWADTPAQMLAPLLVRALERQGALAAVLRAPSGARADLQLETDVLTLEQDFNVSPSVVRLALRLVLLDAASRRPLATREFAASQAAPSEDAEGGVAAAQALTRRVLGEVSDWVVSSLAVRATALTAPAHR
jgi:cholesterol transport system auxiliary component